MVVAVGGGATILTATVAVTAAGVGSAAMLWAENGRLATAWNLGAKATALDRPLAEIPVVPAVGGGAIVLAVGDGDSGGDGRLHLWVWWPGV